MTAKEKRELRTLVNSIVSAREMEKRQRAGVKMLADWSAVLDDSVEMLRERFPLPPSET